MALAGRSARRGVTGARWLTIGVVVTLLVLLVDASLHSRSPSQGQELAAGTWIDRVLPIVASSTAEGQQIDALWSNGLSMSGPAISSDVAEITRGAASNYANVLKLRPPVTLAGPAGLLEAALLARSQAATAVRDALTSALGAASGSSASGSPSSANASAAASLSVPATSSVPASGASSTASSSTSSTSTSTTTSTTTPPAPGALLSQVQAIQTAGNDLQVGDQAYQLFARSMPAKLGVTMPPSVWLANAGPYQAQAATVFLTSLQNTVNTSPVHEVKIYSISTNPSPVAKQGSVEVLPDATAMTLNIVIADVGNQAEPNLTITASISPAGKGAASVRDFVDLVPGQAHSIIGLGPINPPQGVAFTLTVTVTPATGSTTPPVSESLALTMPAPPPPSTTTTTAVSTTRTT